MNQINGFVSLGYSKVEVEGIDVKAPYDGCLMNIAIQKNNSFKGVKLFKQGLHIRNCKFSV